MLADDQHVIRTGETLHMAHVKLRDRRGNTVWLQTTKSPCPVEIFGEEAVIGISVNITKLKESEENLLNSRENLSRILRSIGDAVIVSDQKGRITNMNPAAEKMTGWPLDEALNKSVNTVFRIINEKTGKIAEDSVKEVLCIDGKQSRTEHTVLVSRENKKYKIANSGSPIRKEDGELCGEVIVFRDMTEEYALREKTAAR